MNAVLSWVEFKGQKPITNDEVDEVRDEKEEA